jgi:hypothetical protein
MNGGVGVEPQSAVYMGKCIDAKAVRCARKMASKGFKFSVLRQNALWWVGTDKSRRWSCPWKANWGRCAAELNKSQSGRSPFGHKVGVRPGFMPSS